MSFQPLQRNHDATSELTRDWLLVLIENGNLEELWNAFLSELTPYAAQVARRELRKRLPPESDADVLAKLHPFLAQMRDALELVVLNPDMMAPASEHMQRELSEVHVELGNWIDYLGRRRPTSPEATVQPTATVMMAAGGVP